MEAAAAEASAAARGIAKAAADAPGARAALAPELTKEPGGGADGMAEDAEEIPGRPEELKTRGGSLSCQQLGSKCGSPGRETNTDQAFEITPAQQCDYFECNYYIKLIAGVHLYGIIPA